MNKPLQLMLVEQAIEEHPFSDLQDLHLFIDSYIENMMFGKGRPAGVTKKANACRASV